jgi:hypothetical protein
MFKKLLQNKVDRAKKVRALQQKGQIKEDNLSRQVEFELTRGPVWKEAVEPLCEKLYLLRWYNKIDSWTSSY